MGSRPQVNAGMSTFGDRADQLPAAIDSILPQVDRLGVYLGRGYDGIPACCEREKIVVFHHRTQPVIGDIGDAGKFLFAEMDGWEGYYLSVDDDLIYPEDFVDRHLAAMDRYEDRAVVSVHGAILRHQPTESYYRDGRQTFHFKRDLEEDREVHIAATLGAIFHTDHLEFDAGHCKPASQMSDIWISVAAKIQGVPRIVRAHRSSENGGVRQNPEVDLSSSIYQNHHLDDDLQTRTVNQYVPWELQGVT